MDNLTRRDFLKIFNRLLAATGLAAILSPVVAYFYPPNLEEIPADPVLVGSAAELPVGASKTVRFGRYPALVIHTAGGLRAFSAVCTHFACVVKWDEAAEQIVCPCHEGYFDASGAVVSGPPPTPLASLAVWQVGDEIYVGSEA